MREYEFYDDPSPSISIQEVFVARNGPVHGNLITLVFYRLRRIQALPEGWRKPDGIEGN